MAETLEKLDISGLLASYSVTKKSVLENIGSRIYLSCELNGRMLVINTSCSFENLQLSRKLQRPTRSSKTNILLQQEGGW